MMTDIKPKTPDNSGSQSKAYRGGKEEATQAYNDIRRETADAANKGR